MQYQTKWMTNILKLFAPRKSSLIRTLLVVGLLIGCLGIAFVSLQQSLLNAQASSAAAQNSSQARSVSITVSSHIDQQRATYTLTVHTSAHAGIIRRGISITFTDSIPVGLSHISATGSHWNTKVSSKVGPSLVTGTYKGSYPIGPGSSLPAVVIEGIINPHASKVLTNSASVNVWGNTDKTHSKAVVRDNIQPTLSSLPLVNRNDNSGTCDSSCNVNDNNVCDNSCNEQASDACNNQCGSPLSTSDACNNQCGSSLSTSDACNNQCGSSLSTSDACNSQCGGSQSTSDACNSQCDQTSAQTSTREKVHISVQESKSVDTSCECSQQGTTGNGNVSTPSNVTSTSKHDPSGKGSTTPFPALPNTGSDPNYK